MSTSKYFFVVVYLAQIFPRHTNNCMAAHGQKNIKSKSASTHPAELNERGSGSRGRSLRMTTAVSPFPQDVQLVTDYKEVPDVYAEKERNRKPGEKTAGNC